MTRALKYDIPGVDRRVEPERVRERGWAEAFAPDLAPSLRLIVDVGFGRGEFLLELARSDPAAALVGIEYSFKRVLKMARRLARTEITNVRLVEMEAERAVRELFPEDSVACFWINFPDPWPKKRHHRRRLLQPEFVRDLASRLEPGGVVNVATDHPGYAEVIDAALSGAPRLENLFAPDRYREAVPGRKPTAYEMEWRRENRSLHYFAYRRVQAGGRR